MPPKAGKFYCHYEDSEPNFTSPFVLDPSLTFAMLRGEFCTKYNNKHGSVQQLLPDCVEVKVGSKVMEGEQNVVEHVSPGDDVYFTGAASPPSNDVPNGGQPSASIPAAAAAASAEPAAAAAAAAAQPVLPPIKLKVYVHYESAASEDKDPSATQAFQITNATHSVGQLIEEFIATYNRKNAERSNFVKLDPHTLCARTDSQVVVAVDRFVNDAFSNGDDIWIVPLEIALREDNTAIDTSASVNPIEASKTKARDKSYYYWAQRTTAAEAPAPIEAPKQIRTRQARTEETTVFKTISSYSFVDDDNFVKVYVTMPGVGAEGGATIESEFNTRSCCVRVLNYNGANHRLQVPKLSEEIEPAKSSVRANKDTLIIKLCKVKKDHHWYELHKTKGIGED